MDYKNIGKLLNKMVRGVLYKLIKYCAWYRRLKPGGLDFSCLDEQRPREPEGLVQGHPGQN